MQTKTTTVISKSSKKKKMEDGSYSFTKMVVTKIDDGKNKKGKNIYRSYTDHVKA